ncbi:MAG: selenide, water dikinase SelD, partial [Candidatus Hydrogenedentota bacterium]
MLKLTEFSHGAGCGCKLSPAVLEEIIGKVSFPLGDNRLLVGQSTKDDAAAYQWDDQNILLSTTDFFLPIEDDPFLFGKIAAANALSDIYAMGGTPILALAILGWPINKLPASEASKVMAGAVEICKEARVVLAGGHSIDSPEPIFGLAVNGKVEKAKLKLNSNAQKGDVL